MNCLHGNFCEVNKDENISLTNFPRPWNNMLFTVTGNKFIVWSYHFSAPTSFYLVNFSNIIKVQNMFKVNNRSTRGCSGVFIKYLQPQFLHFRVGSRSPVTFKTKLYVTTVNNSFLPLFIFCYKEHHVRCCIGLTLNIVTWSTNRYQGHPSSWSSATLGKYEKLTFLDAFKIHFQKFFELNLVLHLTSNRLNIVSINSLT